MGKKIVQFVLTLIFIILVICGVVAGSYMLNHPSTVGDSRLIMSGAWIDEKKDMMLEFTQESGFKITNTKNNTVIADGYYKISEDADGQGKIKLFILPKHHDTSFDDAMQYKFFAQIAYSNLTDAEKDSNGNEKSDSKPTATFLIRNSDDVYECEMPEKTLKLYNKKEFKTD